MLGLFTSAPLGWVGESSYRLSDDLPTWGTAGVFLLVALSVVLLWIEVRRQHPRALWVLLTGVLGTVALALAVLRPVHVTLKGRAIPGSVIVLLDSSHRMDLPATDRFSVLDRSRRQVAEETVESLRRHLSGSRMVVREFDNGLTSEAGAGKGVASDLLAALGQALGESAEMPSSVVVISDGRFARPSATVDDNWTQALKSAAQGVTVHTVGVSQAYPADRSLRSVGMTGSAVAHQPFRLEIEVGCEPAASCDDAEVQVKELLERQEPQLLSTGRAKFDQGRALLSLELTLEQAGNRALLVELASGEADDVMQNDRRIVPVFVRRDRLRMLHVAGRPTYDVRALRKFLKSDESIDLVSFFILRTESDQVQAEQEELALIPFPVDELFSEHLSSFDAIILQDIDAPRYRLDRYLGALRDYVVRGGGLILVGGPTGFSSGGYAGSALEEVLPIQLPREGELIVRKGFVPQFTEAGRVAPILKALRSTMGEELPEMSGANALGSARPGALVLWEHPTELARAGATTQKMPVLAVYERGDGRSVAISVDGSHQLRFGTVGAKTGGRAHADLWEGLLGWLMRDPRYESAQLRLEGECLAHRDQTLLVDPLPGLGDDLQVTLEKLGAGVSDSFPLQQLEPGTGGTRRFVARQIPEGGYAARVRVGAAPPTRSVIACEDGGEAWSDSRPDPERMAAIAAATGGTYVTSDQVGALPKSTSSFIATHRESRPFLEAWVWATLAVSLMSLHWLVRRSVGHV